MPPQTKFPPLRRIHPRGLANNIEVLYSPEVAPQPFDREKLLSFSPVRFVIRDKLSQQRADRLTWSFATHPSRSEIPLATMRNRLARRWMQAMRVALRENGYECDGRRPALEPGLPRSEGLKGTLTTLIHKANGVDKPIEDLVRDADAIVKALQLPLKGAPRSHPGARGAQNR